MLTIKHVKGYKLPRYPRDAYYEHPMTFSIKKSGVASAALFALLLSSCKPVTGDDGRTPDGKTAGQPPEQKTIGISGPPPMPPTMVTGREITEEMARDAFDKAFAKNGINLKTDVPFIFPLNGNNVSLVLDGFDPNLKVGYEYISPNDFASFDSVVENALDKASESKEKGPKILTIEGFRFSGDSPYFSLQLIEENVDKFIYNLRLNGLI